MAFLAFNLVEIASPGTLPKGFLPEVLRMLGQTQRWELMSMGVGAKDTPRQFGSRPAIFQLSIATEVLVRQ